MMIDLNLIDNSLIILSFMAVFNITVSIISAILSIAILCISINSFMENYDKNGTFLQQCKYFTVLTPRLKYIFVLYYAVSDIIRLMLCFLPL